MTERSLTTTEEAARLRAEYKKLGWNSRMISVRCESFSMGSSITVTVKSPDVDFVVAEEIANSAESIRRDAMGEILGGGNRYLHFKFSRECQAQLAVPYLRALTAALGRLPEDERNRFEPIEGVESAYVGREGFRDGVINLDGQRRIVFYAATTEGVIDGAFRLAVLLNQERRATTTTEKPKEKQMASTAAARTRSLQERHKCQVPLGSKTGEEKGATKVVRRVVHDMSGKSPKRTGKVNWRGSFYSANEFDDKPGLFVLGRKTKAPEVEES